MSLFLVYLELGRPVPIYLPREPLIARPIRVRSERRSGPPKSGFVITDGLASDHFFQYNNRVTGRRGDALRTSLYQFLSQRLGAGARPVFSFEIVHGRLEEIEIALDLRRMVTFKVLPEEFARLRPHEAVEVLSGDSKVW